MGADSAGVYKGPRGQYQQAYVIATPFEVVETGSQPEHSAVASSASDAAADTDKATAADVRYTGIKGRSLAVGQYRLAADNPGRLIISFNSELPADPEPLLSAPPPPPTHPYPSIMPAQQHVVAKQDSNRLDCPLTQQLLQ